MNFNVEAGVQLVANSPSRIAGEQVLVVYAPLGDWLAQEYGVFAPPPGRTYRACEYLAFYAEGQIRQVYRIEGSENLAPEHPTLVVLRDAGCEVEGDQPTLVWRVKPYATLKPVVNDLVSVRSGKPVHYTYGQARYTSLASLLEAQRTSELVNMPKPNSAKLTFDYIEGLRAKALPVPENEAERLATLHDYEQLDTEPENEFDTLTKLASAVCGTSICVISLVDSDRQWFKSTFGIDAKETSREVSFCQYAIMNNQVMEVKNATEDPRFMNNPLVTGNPNIRFYAGAPLQAPNGHNIGTLCVIDDKPMELTTAQKEILRQLAAEVTARMELKKKNKELQQLNESLQQTLENLKETQHQLAETNADLRHSIRYARRIQEGILPRAEYVKEVLPESFIYYQPKDIVSGDFYWLHRKRNKTMVVAADCTGHGVPGAFMSMVGISNLTKLVEERGLMEPASVLEELHLELRHSLGQDLDEDMPETRLNADSIDMSVVSLDPDRKQFQFAAAHRKAIWVKTNGEAVILEGDKASVGGYSYGKLTEHQRFTLQLHAYTPGDMLYLFTDGLTDQFSCSFRGRFQLNRLTDMLKRVAPLPLAEQKATVIGEFKTWQGTTAQTDDILLIGMRLQ
jgi:serine phosphatase RsbU (regulator of sigma subunit)